MSTEQESSETGEAIKQHIQDNTSDIYAESLMSNLVKSAGIQLEQISQESEGCMSLITNLANNCSGTLKVRALNPKDKTTYTISICSSKLIYETGQTVIQQANVETE